MVKENRGFDKNQVRVNANIRKSQVHCVEKWQQEIPVYLALN